MKYVINSIKVIVRDKAFEMTQVRRTREYINFSQCVEVPKLHLSLTV